ncbi:MAG: peptide-methionine (R)-S-oxide reductase MsrB [Thiotrichaceae bacterium]|nr:peptide-methionine (R)-S-oxide reductase MsrB [Thiotrichaceae bacterium]
MLKWNDVLSLSEQGVAPVEQAIEKTSEEWRALLSSEQFHITRHSGTESPFSSTMCSLFKRGIYRCTCCHVAGEETRLFDASEKFDSGTGWPSFTQPLIPNAVAYNKDSSQGMVRIEAICNTCKAHLGHVFPDGPEPSGLRYCINAISLHKISSSIDNDACD